MAATKKTPNETYRPVGHFFSSLKNNQKFKGREIRSENFPSFSHKHNPNHHPFSEAALIAAALAPSHAAWSVAQRGTFFPQSKPSDQGKDLAHKSVAAQTPDCEMEVASARKCFSSFLLQSQSSQFYTILGCCLLLGTTSCFREWRLIFNSLSELQKHKMKGNKRKSNCRLWIVLQGHTKRCTKDGAQQLEPPRLQAMAGINPLSLMLQIHEKFSSLQNYVFKGCISFLRQFSTRCWLVERDSREQGQASRFGNLTELYL